MEIFNVGPLELGLVLLLALIVLGPEGMVSFARKSSRWIVKIIRSPIWKDLVNTSEEVRSIPKQLLKEANLEDSLRELNDLTRKPFIPSTELLKKIEKPLEDENTQKEDVNK
jgi:hypothetical protein